mmetsp:Transcript_75/g.166  ORF Transcript_75/g.166 Transcript_75/m.166 type:complete len:503 (-) Transcript_75:154-1662(-)
MDDAQDNDSSDGADFFLFQWDKDGCMDGTTESNEEASILIRSRADFVQKLSRLALDEVDDVCGDLHSVASRIGSPFPCQLLRSNTTNRTRNACHLKNDGSVEPSIGCIICIILDLWQRTNAVKKYMGSMAQCRGAGGDALREAGAISALLCTLWRLIVPLRAQVGKDVNEKIDVSLSSFLPTMASEPLTCNADMKPGVEEICNNHLHLQNDSLNVCDIAMNEFDSTTLDLAISCLGSLRDLSCGSALNRAAVLAWEPPSPTIYDEHCIENGVHVLSTYVRRYDQLKWEKILSLKERGINSNSNAVNSTTYSKTDRGEKELRLLTNVLGTIRNTSHSTPDVCQEFFNHGLVDPLVWRIMPNDDAQKYSNTQLTTPLPSSLPEASCPWRESCFRAAGSLINLAEKCPDVAHQLGSNRKLIYLLIETWGGVSAITVDPNKMNASTRRLPLLHLGLAAIINAAANGALAGGLDNIMSQVLEKEIIRKRVAQRKEEERKLRQTKQMP